MTETVESRLHLLQDSNQISPEITTATRRLADSVEAYLEVSLSGSVAMSFITHLALGLERLLNGAPLENALPDDLLAEARDRPDDWAFTQRLARQVEQELGVALPESELGYLAIHISTLSEVVNPQGDDV